MDSSCSNQTSNESLTEKTPKSPVESTPSPKAALRSSRSSKTSKRLTLGPVDLPAIKERVLVRDAWGEKTAEIAKAEGLDSREVRKMITNQGIEWSGLKEQIREHLVRRLYEKATFNLDAINSIKAMKESNVQNATTAAILIDKARLLEGQPTNINASVNVDVARLMQPEILKQIIMMRGGVANLRPEHRALAEKLGIVDVEST